MRRALLVLTVVLATVGSAGAHAAGGGPASVLLGGQGVRAPDGKVRYVALTTGRQTVVSVVRVRGGQVVRWRLLRGYFGVPVVGLDGTTEGVSRDGRMLVLATPMGGVTTQFAVIDTRTLRLRRIELRGLWSYDAVSPDASTLFLVEYLSADQNAAYRVRAYDMAVRRLVPGAIVDRLEQETIMRGRPVTRATSRDGRWAYTLYARTKNEPFVHALDTVRREAFCIDLPLELAQAKQMELRLRLAQDGRALDVRSDRETLAVVDTKTFGVRRG